MTETITTTQKTLNTMVADMRKPTQPNYCAPYLPPSSSYGCRVQ